MGSNVYLLSVAFLFSSFDVGPAKELRTCSGDEGTLEMDCGDGIIRVDDSTAFYIPGVDCQLYPHIASVPDACRVEKRQIFHICHGYKRCEMTPKIAIQSVPNCRPYTVANFLVVRYTCLEIGPIVPIHDAMTGSTIHIFSPRFSESMPESTYTFSCIIRPANTAGQEGFGVRITQMFILFPRDHPYCTELLYFTGAVNSDENSDSSLRFCSFYEGFEEWNVETDHTVNDELRMTYVKSRDSGGGRFWLQMEGYHNGAAIELKLTCPDQSQIPVGAFILGAAATSPEITTATTATTTRQTTTGAKSDNNTGRATTETKRDSGDENGIVLYIVIGVVGFVLLVMILVIFLLCRHRKRKLSHDEVDSKTKSTKRAAIGSVLYSDVAQGNGDAFHYLEAKKSLKENIYEDEGNDMYSTVHEHNADKDKNVVAATGKNGAIPGMYDSIDGPPSKADGKNDLMDTDGEMYSAVRDPSENKNEDGDTDKVPGEMYATIDKGKKRKNSAKTDKSDEQEMYATVDKGKNKKKETGVIRSNPDQDDTIMCENEDIYETGPNEIKDEKEKQYPEGDENDGPIRPAGGYENVEINS